MHVNLCINSANKTISLCMYVRMHVCVSIGELTDVLLVLTTEGAVQAFSSNAQIAVGTEVAPCTIECL